MTEGIPEPPKEQNSWLFTRGQESICIVRVTLAFGRMRLLIRGPGYVVTDLHFPNLAACRCRSCRSAGSEDPAYRRSHPGAPEPEAWSPKPFTA